MASPERMSQGTTATGVASNLPATHWPALAAHPFWAMPTSSPVPGGVLGAWFCYRPGVSGDWRVWKVKSLQAVAWLGVSGVMETCASDRSGIVSKGTWSVEILSELCRIHYIHNSISSTVCTILRTIRVGGSLDTCPTRLRIVFLVLGYSGVCTEVDIATGPALGAETSQWSAMIRDTREIRHKNSSDMECH